MVSNRCNDYGTLKFIIMKNREIKFRSFYNNKTMLYSESYVNLQFFFELKPEQFPLMQYTGLKDKNGKEIYERDVLKVGENLTCEILYIGQNVDDYGDEINSAFHANVYRHDKIIPIDSYFKNECVVIGNIYENPELCTK